MDGFASFKSPEFWAVSSYLIGPRPWPIQVKVDPDQFEACCHLQFLFD